MPGTLENLVMRVRRLEAAGDAPSARAASAQVLAQLRPLVERIAQARVRRAGTLSLEDLVQVGNVELLKCIASFRQNGRRTRSFEAWSALHVKAAVEQHVRLHGGDVHASDGALRGRTRTAASPLQLLDAAAPVGRHADEDDLHLVDEALAQPDGREAETHRIRALDVQRLKIALPCIPDAQQDVVRHVYGIGKPQLSVAELARRRRVPKQRLDKLLREGVLLLQALMGGTA